MTLPKEIQELRASIETLTKKYKETKAMPPGEMENDKMEDMEEMMFELIGYVHQRISYLENSFYDFQHVHSQGHIPAIKSAGKMENALKTLGLAEDYQVWKPMIAAASNKYGLDVKE